MSGKIDVPSIDTAAAALLAAAEQDGPLADRVKAFEAVTGWVELRAKIAPKTEKAAFDGIRDKFRSGAAKRGAAADAAETGEDGED